MNDKRTGAGASDTAAEIRTVLRSQYHATLAMLRQAIELCPDAIWVGGEQTNAPWQIAYHTLFFTHLYIQTDEHAFEPWEHHQADNQYPDAIPGPPDPKSDLALTPDPYTKEQMLSYWSVCDEMVDDAVDAMDVLAPESGFSWYKVSKLEHQIVNVRHVEHGAAQIADRVRAVTGNGIDWVGSKPSGR